MKPTLSFILVVFSLAACAPVPTPARENMIQTIVASTLTAHPADRPTDLPEAIPIFPELSQTPTLAAPVFTETALPTLTAALPPPATLTVLPQFSEQDLYRVLALPNPQNPALSDIYIHNNQTGEEFFFTSLKNISRNHYHVGEYRHGNLYVLAETGSGDAWTNELWRFDPQGGSRMLFSEPGLDFRVSPDEHFIAVVYNPTDRPSGQKLSILQSQGKVKKKFNAEDLGQLGGDYTVPLRWSDPGSTFWAARHTGPRVYSFHKIEAGSWEITNYSVSSLPLNDISESDLNANTGLIVFSDHPPLFDVQNAERFKASGQTVTLYVYDLNKRELRTITTSAARKFDPKWINDKTVEYNDPNGDGRIIYVVP